MIINQLAINPVGNYQQLAHQIQQHLPTLLPPIQQTEPTSPIRHIDEAPQEKAQNQQITLHTTVDYTPWLQRLYLELSQSLHQTFALPNTHQQQRMLPSQWHPEATAKAINALALSYSGFLWHQQGQEVTLVIEKLTKLWRETWQRYRLDIQNSQKNPGLLQALDTTGLLVNKYWLESWLHLAELQRSLPTESKANPE